MAEQVCFPPTYVRSSSAFCFGSATKLLTATAVLHKVDENGDGLIDREEAVLALAAWREMATMKVNRCET